jgi:hypothetical protein
LKKFPHLVQMHRELGPQGLVIMSVSTDAAEDSPQVLDFLKQRGAAFPNFLLDDTEENVRQWRDRYPTEPQPMMWIYNRAGQRVVQDEGKMKSPEVDAKIKQLLAETP